MTRQATAIRPGRHRHGIGSDGLNPASADLSRERWAKPVHPFAHRLVANVDASLIGEILDVSQRQRIADVEHHHELDDLG